MSHERRLFAAILAAALLLRLPGLDAYGFFHPDEIAQYLEQAHRIAFGYGVVPWDVRFGLRSGLLPLLLSAPMRAGAAIAPGSDLYLLLPRLCVMLVSLAAVWAGWAIGRRRSAAHGLVAASVLAVWYEGVVFADHVLSEPIVAACILAAAALIDGRDRGRALAGALLALAAALRPQYAPAAAILALFALGRGARGWRALLLGAMPMMLLAAAVDLAGGHAPFGQAFANLQQNLVADRAAVYGTLPPLAYLGMLLLQWGPLAIAAPLLIAPVARTHLPLLAAALATLGLHVAVGHKEYRYIWLAAQLLLLLMALGSAELVLRGLARRGAGARVRAAALLALVAGWCALSGALAWSRPMTPYAGHYAARLAITRDAGRTPGLCGLALLETPYWSSTYAYLHRPLPLYLIWRREAAAEAADFARGAPAYDAAIAPAASVTAARAGYRPIACRGEGASRICLWRRHGGCDPRVAPELRIQAVLAREDS